MTLDEFVDKLYEADWRPACDAQDDGVRRLWEELFEIKKDTGAKLACNDGLGDRLQAAMTEVRNLWVDIDESAKLINEGKSHRAVTMLVRARKSSERIAKKHGF